MYMIYACNMNIFPFICTNNKMLYINTYPCIYPLIFPFIYTYI